MSSSQSYCKLITIQMKKRSQSKKQRNRISSLQVQKKQKSQICPIEVQEEEVKIIKIIYLSQNDQTNTGIKKPKIVHFLLPHQTQISILTYEQFKEKYQNILLQYFEEKVKFTDSHKQSYPPNIFSKQQSLNKFSQKQKHLQQSSLLQSHQNTIILQPQYDQIVSQEDQIKKIIEKVKNWQFNERDPIHGQYSMSQQFQSSRCICQVINRSGCFDIKRENSQSYFQASNHSLIDLDSLLAKIDLQPNISKTFFQPLDSLQTHKQSNINSKKVKIHSVPKNQSIEEQQYILMKQHPQKRRKI